MKVWVEVEKIAGNCSAGLKEGDKFAITNGVNIEAKETAALCIYAIAGLIPYLTAYTRNTEPGDWINRLERLACPDPINQVTFRLRREAEND